MPGNPTIDLYVQDHGSNGSDGYTDTTASNGNTYSYRYTGGSGNGGDLTFTQRGAVTIVLQLKGDRRYTISNVSFPSDPNNQLSWVSNSPTTGVIHNKNDAVQVAEYKVTVSDSAANCTVPCDPQIINKGV